MDPDQHEAVRDGGSQAGPGGTQAASQPPPRVRALDLPRDAPLDDSADRDDDIRDTTSFERGRLVTGPRPAGAPRRPWKRTKSAAGHALRER